jgi:Tol biopolymer transport system component
MRLSLYLVILLLAGVPAAHAQSFAFFRVEGPPAAPGGPGVQANSGTAQPALSLDGRVLVFRVGGGSNLAGGASGVQVLALTPATGAITVVSTTAAGAASASGTTNDFPVASADGRFIAFETTSPTYTGGALGVHVVRIDRSTRAASLVNVAPNGTLPSGTTSRVGGISGDGRFVVFTSNAAGLVAGDPGLSTNAVFVRDVQAGSTERIDLAPGGAPANAGVFGERPTISRDGRLVAFASSAGNLLGTPLSGSQRIYLRDRQTGTTTQASIGPGGTDLSGARNPVLSPDGASVVFGSAGSGATATQLWARRLNQPAAVAVPAASGMGICDSARIGDDGLVIAQCRRNGGLPAQAYLWSLAQPSTPPELISGSDPQNTVPGNGVAGTRVTISADGRVFAFDADASDLVPGDSNNATDTFVYADVAILDTLFADGFEP